MAQSTTQATAQARLKLETAPGHEVLAAAGKTVLRPGGRSATEQLFKWAEFQPGQTVLELASGLGNSAIALAQRYGVRVVGIEKDADRVAQAQAQVRSVGLQDQVQILQGDIFHLDAITETFDYVLAEAILTMQSPPAKAQILRGVRDRLKPNGKFLSHELLARTDLEQIHRDLSQAIRVNATPLTETGWKDACTHAGLTVTHSQVGPMGLLNPRQILRDEGFTRALRIGWNVLTKPAIRRRVWQMRQTFDRHQQALGYITLCAVAEPSP
jgi:SAM-dependent methyltransferase